MRSLTIGRHEVSAQSPAYVIAEIGNNHGGSVDVAQQMIRMASASGAQACKFQLRENATLYSRSLLEQPYENEHSFGKTYGAHREALELSDRAFFQCVREAEVSKIDILATAFDEPSADRIVHLGMCAIKIASGGLTDAPLLRHVSSLGLPIILSTGGGTLKDIDRAVQLITAKTNQLAVLHCVAAYPVRDWAQHNLRVIETLLLEYPDLVIGWSGHDNGIALSVAAYTLGARIIEKHFTLDRSSKGGDHAFSLEPSGLKKMCRDLERTYLALGDGVKQYYASEVGPISKMRRRQTPEGPQITGEKDEPTAA